MKPLALVAALLLTAGPAAAQVPPPASAPPQAAIDPVKLQLARDLVKEQGGEARVRQQMHAMFAAMDKNMQAILPPDAKSFAPRFHDTLAQGMDSITPQLLDISVRAWADNLTEKELRDELAFARTETSRSVREKQPLILQQVLAQTLPLTVALIPKMMTDVVEQVCQQEHCTPDQRQKLMAAMSKALPGQGPAPG